MTSPISPIETDKFGYIIDVYKRQLSEWMKNYPEIPVIHFKRPIQPEHRSICNFYTRNFLTKKKELVTCDSCKELIKKLKIK
jgi:hypothetical protein